jgi:FAD binding domain
MVQHMQHSSSIDTSATVETKAEQGDQYAYLQALQALRKRLRGELVLPENLEYESARTVWNGEANCHPALIVRCVDADDVAASVTFAKVQGLALSVRSGGHSPAGYGTNDGGIVIDLSQMKAISIDPERCRARLEAGLTWNEVANALQPYNLALTSGDTGTVGVGGLMLGGGIGWMVRKYGMTIDHLCEVELVTADGQHLRASGDEHPDLFWGLRGGGGNFGIATAFEVEIHQAGMVLGGGCVLRDGRCRHHFKGICSLRCGGPGRTDYDGLTNDCTSCTVHSTLEAGCSGRRHLHMLHRRPGSRRTGHRSSATTRDNRCRRDLSHSLSRHVRLHGGGGKTWLPAVCSLAVCI